jgi:hypothetical protein
LRLAAPFVPPFHCRCLRVLIELLRLLMMGLSITVESSAPLTMPPLMRVLLGCFILGENLESLMTEIAGKLDVKRDAVVLDSIKTVTWVTMQVCAPNLELLLSTLSFCSHTQFSGSFVAFHISC